MSLDPDMTCPWCGSVNLYEDLYYDDEGNLCDVDIYCLLCERKVM